MRTWFAIALPALFLGVYVVPAPDLEEEGGGCVLVQYRGGAARAGPPGAQPAPKEGP